MRKILRLRHRKPSAPSPLDFFQHLRWIDGRALLDVIEPYRRRIFMDVLYTFKPDGSPRYNLALLGRGAKNWKSTDAILAGFYRLLAWPLAPQGNDVLIVANDESQAGDDLVLAKKLIECNPIIEREVNVLSKSIERSDGGGSMLILPAGDVTGSHGKTYAALVFDEMHGSRDYGLLEALKLDPSRPDALMWITTYDSLIHRPGIPVYDFVLRGKAGDDPSMYFSWYSGDYCTDPAFASLPPEQRANPSAASWGNPGYLAQQRRRLPTNRFRRLHLNLGGQSEGAFFDADAVQACVIPGRRHLSPQPAVSYCAFVDMAGGSGDEAVLGIAHRDAATNRAVLDAIVTQTGAAPFNPRQAVLKFAGVLKEYRLSEVTGDAYAGETFRLDFSSAGISYRVADMTKSELYEQLEPKVNATEVELLDEPVMLDQLLGLVMRGSKIDHQSGEHDDRINAAAGALLLVRQYGAIDIASQGFCPDRNEERADRDTHLAELGFAADAPDYQSGPFNDDDWRIT